MTDERRAMQWRPKLTIIEIGAVTSGAALRIGRLALLGLRGGI